MDARPADEHVVGAQRRRRDPRGAARRELRRAQPEERLPLWRRERVEGAATSTARTLAPTLTLTPTLTLSPAPTLALTLTLTLSLSLGLTLSLSLTRCDGLSGLGDLGKNRGSVEGEVCVQS